MNVNEIESRPEERFDLIRFDLDLIRLRFDADLVPILPNYGSASIQFNFNSTRFDIAPPVTLLLLLLLFNLYRTSMPPGVLSSVVISLTILISSIAYI
jgi:hypothetical protein